MDSSDLKTVEYEGEPRQLFLSKVREKKYWEFIRLVAPSTSLPQGKIQWTSDDVIALYCTRCKELLRFVKGNSNTLRRHLQRNHQQFLVDADLKEKQAKDKRQSSSIQSYFSTDPTAHKKMKPSSLADAGKFNRLVATWICRSLRPLSIVEDEGLQEVIEFANTCKESLPLYKRKTATENVEIVAAELRDKLHNLIQEEMLYYSETTDIWTSSATESFISFTLHYVTQDFDFKNWTLEVKKFDGKHTGMAIRDALQKVMDDWSLNIDNLVIFLRDNASNGVKAMDEMGISHMGCIAHSMNLVISPLLFDRVKFTSEKMAVESEESDDFLKTLPHNDNMLIESIRQRIKNMREISKYFSNSPKGAAQLKSIQSGLLNVSRPLGTTIDCKTRWNSTFDMLERLLKLQRAIDSFFNYIQYGVGKPEFSDFKLSAPTSSDWFVVDGLTKILAPFKKATEILSGEQYPTLLLVFPVLRSVKRGLDPTEMRSTLEALRQVEYSESDVALQTLLEGCASYLRREFVSWFSRMEPTLLWITMINPIFVKMNHLENEEKESVKRNLIQMMSKQGEEKMRHVQVQSQNGVGRTSVSATCNEQRHTSIILSLLHEDNRSSDEEENIILDSVRQATSELELYIMKAKEELKNWKASGTSQPYDVMKFWKTNQLQFPLLAPIARKWLCALATSVPSERRFSTGGNIVTQKQAALSGEHIRDILFVHDNFDSLNNA